MKFYHDQFKSIREAKGITNKEIAEKLDISEQAVQKWNSGAAKPRAAKIFDIARILGCDTTMISDVTPLDKHNPALQTSNLFPGLSSTKEIDDQLIIAFLHDPKNKKRREELLFEAKMHALEQYALMKQANGND